MIGVTGLLVAQTPEPPMPEPNLDPGTTKFMSSCAGCHSLNGQKLTGPSLNTVGAWAVADLKGGIKRMEKQVGPLTEMEISQLVDFLKAPDILERVKKEEMRISLQFAAKMEPANAQLGRGIYWGGVPLKNHGLSCAACHTVEGRGGNLGPDLTMIASKMGETALISAIEKSSFKIMEPHYRERPVTKQEARHLVKYFGTLSAENISREKPYDMIIGLASAVVLMGLMTSYYARGKLGQRPRLQRRRK